MDLFATHLAEEILNMFFSRPGSQVLTARSWASPGLAEMSCE